ncbi:MAG: hypothetical protein ACTS2F_16755 [Thainema sp.]
MTEARSDQPNNPELSQPSHSSGEMQMEQPSALKSAVESVLDLTQSALPPRKTLGWFLSAAMICGAAGAVTIGAVVWLVSLPPAADCQKITSLSSDRERLQCAQMAAQSGDLNELIAGLELVENWTTEHPLYQESRTWLGDWSESILDVAQDRMNQGDFEGAIALAERIPDSSPAYGDAEATIAEWQGIKNQGQAIYDQAQAAIKQKNWEAANTFIAQLSELDHRFWNSQQTTALSSQVLVEQQAHRQFMQALKAAEDYSPQGMSQAMTIFSSIDPSTYTWQEGQSTFDQWSETLLKVGLQRWYDEKFDSAIALSKRVALNQKFAKEAQNLQWLSESRREAGRSLSTWAAKPDDSWQLIKAIAIASQIKSDSQFFPQAQSSLQSWIVQLQDLSQLQIAQAVATVGTPAAYETAMAHAQLIPPEHQRRQQAQTLAAYWSDEIERQEDRHHLVTARRLAKAYTPKALQSAIAEASQIDLGRALRIEAQTLIAEWRVQIQTIEDQPILTKATALARKNQWSQAITVASQIQPDRALYEKAQSAIEDWEYQIYLTEERERQRAAEAAAEAARVNEADNFSVAEPEVASPESAESAPASNRNRESRSSRNSNSRNSNSIGTTSEPAWSDSFTDENGAENIPLKPGDQVQIEQPRSNPVPEVRPTMAPSPAAPSVAVPTEPAPPKQPPPPVIQGQPSESQPAPVYAPPVSTESSAQPEPAPPAQPTEELQRLSRRIVQPPESFPVVASGPLYVQG